MSQSEEKRREWTRVLANPSFTMGIVGIEEVDPDPVTLVSRDLLQEALGVADALHWKQTWIGTIPDPNDDDANPLLLLASDRLEDADCAIGIGPREEA